MNTLSECVEAQQALLDSIDYTDSAISPKDLIYVLKHALRMASILDDESQFTTCFNQYLSSDIQIKTGLDREQLFSDFKAWLKPETDEDGDFANCCSYECVRNELF